MQMEGNVFVGRRGMHGEIEATECAVSNATVCLNMKTAGRKSDQILSCVESGKDSCRLCTPHLFNLQSHLANSD